MKKSLLLVLGLAATMVLAACEPTEPTPSTTDSIGTEDTSVYVTGIEIVDYDTKAPIDVLNISLTNGGDVDVVLTPTNADVQDVTWSVSEEGILDLTEIDYGSVEALKAGTVTLTATAVGAEEGTTVSDSITVNVSEYTYLDIADFATAAEDGQIYAFSGILEDLDHNDQYGNAFVTDPATGATLKLYGSTTTESALTKDESGAYDYKNPKDAKTTLADYENGELVTGYGLWDGDFGNLSAIFTNHEADDTKYTASVSTEIENGTATLDKSADLAYGETVTVTVAPAEGYVANSVVVETAYGQISAEKTGETTFTFKATCKNVVKATFFKPVVGAISVDLTMSSGNLAAFGLSTQYTSANAEIQDLTFEGTYMNVSKQSNWTEELLVLADRSDKVTAPEGGTLTITGKTFTSIEVTYRWWANADTTFAIQYSNDGSVWTDLMAPTAQPSGVDFAEDQHYTSAGTEFEATMLRLCVNTDKDSNRRVGLVNITVGTK